MSIKVAINGFGRIGRNILEPNMNHPNMMTLRSLL